MNIKKFIAPTMPEVMKKVKSELGENAVILNSKVVYNGGFLGLFRKKNVEVIAVQDEQPLEKIETAKVKVIDALQPKKVKDQSNKEILSELNKLKNDLKTYMDQQRFSLDVYPEEIQLVLQNLIIAGVDEGIVKHHGDILLQKWRTAQEIPSPNEIKKMSHQEVINHLSSFTYKGIPENTKILSFVGPTGVGKTTTIAKLAAEAVIKEKKSVAFITTDTYRIAAIEQLKTYAELLSVPIEVVYEDKDFLPAINKFSNYDLIFVDTAGRNYREKKYIEDLNKLYGNVENIITYLVLSISMKEQDMINIIENFLDLNINYFIFSKVDESTSFGVMYNLISRYKLGVAYVTTGQNVPDDIKQATPELIANYVIGNEYDE